MIGNLLVSADRVCDYIPIISTVSNTVGLFQKYCVIDCIDDRDLANGHYYTYLKEKSTMRSVVLLIPVIGNVLVSLHDLCPTMRGGHWYGTLSAPDGIELRGASNAENDGGPEPSSSELRCFAAVLLLLHCCSCCYS